MNNKNDLVSIITPVYNNERFIEHTIDSVLSQSYNNFEFILIDDYSTDKSVSIIKKMAKKDSRIRLFCLSANSGAAFARNKGLEVSRGRYITYLDADDLWDPTKLEKQVKFLNESNCYFSCCSYNVLKENGALTSKIVKMPKVISYEYFLRNTIIQTVGVIVDTHYIDKSLLIMPNVRRGQDAATWAQILKSGINCYGQDDVLAFYRRVSNSLSSNKIKAIKRTWYWYRKIERLNFIKASISFLGYAYNASKKRL